MKPTALEQGQKNRSSILVDCSTISFHACWQDKELKR